MASMYELFTLQLMLQLLNDHMISRVHIFVLITFSFLICDYD
jgi:hypothetical protein